MKEGRLVATTCTTGWSDWIHGELWLFPDGILRVRRSLLKTALFPALASTDELSIREFANGEPEELSKLHRTNLLVQAREIESADLHTGLATASVRQ